MLVNKTDKSYVERMSMPNENWIGDEFYLVDSNSELASKVRENFPNFEFVLDDEGNLIDVTPVQSLEMVEQKKEILISESKTKLAQWLAENPMQFTDGKYYAVTEEKQSLLNSNLASYERAVRYDIEYPLKWNSTGEECVEWLYSDLLALSLAIAGYVAPKVAIQQAVELQIKACTTLEECEAIAIDYS